MKPWLFFFLLLSRFCLAQNTEKQLKSITTEDEAAAFIQAHPALQGVVFALYSTQDTTALYKPFFRKGAGYTLTQDAYTYKILSDTTALYHRVSYIFLGGTKRSRAQIDSTRNIILQKLNEGVPFHELALQYTMDGNTNGGDTGWFTEGTMVPEFERALKKHKAPEVFTIDIPKRGWYYVVKKTFDSRVSKRLTVLRVKAGS